MSYRPIYFVKYLKDNQQEVGSVFGEREKNRLQTSRLQKTGAQQVKYQKFLLGSEENSCNFFYIEIAYDKLSKIETFELENIEMQE